jgi:hypothetical protein
MMYFSFKTKKREKKTIKRKVEKKQKKKKEKRLPPIKKALNTAQTTK